MARIKVNEFVMEIRGRVLATLEGNRDMVEAIEMYNRMYTNFPEGYDNEYVSDKEGEDVEVGIVSEKIARQVAMVVIDRLTGAKDSESVSPVISSYVDKVMYNLVTYKANQGAEGKKVRPVNFGEIRSRK